MRSATSRSGTSLVAGIVIAGALAAPGSAAAAQQRTAVARCVPPANVGVVVDDSGSMAGSDRNELRRSGLELFIRAPQNASKSLSAVEFGSPPAASIFGPAPIATNAVAMIAALRAATNADNGASDYDSGLTLGFMENPAADARIFLTDGADDGAVTNAHLLEPAGRAPAAVYVVGLDTGRAGSGAVADRLQTIATQTGGRYFPDVSQVTAQSVFGSIAALVNCRALPATFTSRVFTARRQQRSRAFTLPRAGRRVDVVLNWAQPANRFSFATITALGAGDRVLATLSGRGQPRKLSIRKFSGSTFRSLDIRRPQGARRLRVTIKPSALTSSEPTVTQLSTRG